MKLFVTVEKKPVIDKWKIIRNERADNDDVTETALGVFAVDQQSSPCIKVRLSLVHTSIDCLTVCLCDHRIMPLASSRSSSLKREETVAAERKERKRRERLSLPSTCQSSTVVNAAKARRRLSIRQNSDSSLAKKENEDPGRRLTRSRSAAPPSSPSGPTPYWQVRILRF